MTSSVDRRVTSLQYALDLFVEMAPVQKPIDEVRSDQDIGFHKNTIFARIIGLGMVARRFVDAAYFIVAQEPESRDSYEVSLSFFKWLMRYDSRNTKHFSAVIREVKASMLEVTNAPVEVVDGAGRIVEDSDSREEEDEFEDRVSSRQVATVSNEDGDWLELIGRVRVRNGYIRFRVPEELQRLIKDPENSYWTSLLVTSRFTLIYARGIYDHVLPTVDKGRTDWLPLQLVRNLPGKSWANNNEFKFFKRDYLEKAVAQINQLSDITISYETRAGTPKSRKQDQIRFKMERKESAQASKAAMLNSVALFQTLQREFGLTDRHFDRIASNRETWSDARIEQAIEYVRREIRRGNKITRVAGYLMKVIDAGGFVSEADKEVDRIQAQIAAKSSAEDVAKTSTQCAVAASVAAADAAAEKRRAEETRMATEFFAAADKKMRDELVRKFATTNTIGIRTIERQGLKPADVSEANIMDRPTIAASFCSFVAGEMRKAARTRSKNQSSLI